MRLRRLWNAINPSYRPDFRKIFCSILEEIDPVRGGIISKQMRSWKSRRSLNTGKSVLEWDPRQGAMVSSELEMLRRHLEPLSAEDVSNHFARLVIRLALTTLRRPSQILQINADGLRRHTTKVGTTAEIEIPLAKGKADLPPRWEPIPNDLANDIDAYRARAPIAGSTAAELKLLPHVSTSNGVLTANNTYGAVVKGKIQSWAKRKGIISPRTDEGLNVSFRRLRHSGVTHMAMQGYSIELLADVLQHAEPGTARYYIDAVGVEFLPIFEKADRNLGGRFSAMRDAWFKGSVVNRDEANDCLIMVPEEKAPAIVGACGSTNGCSLNPLFSCYSCQHFLAFRNADHAKVLDFLEKEYEHWRSSEVSNSKSKAIKDFDRAAAGVREVIDQIRDEHLNAKG